MDWKEIIFTDEFKAYRQRQTKEIAEMVQIALSGIQYCGFQNWDYFN